MLLRYYNKEKRTMPTIEEIRENSYIVVENGDYKGKVLEVFNSSDSGNFLECRDNEGNRIGSPISRNDVRLANEDEIRDFQRL